MKKIVIGLTLLIMVFILTGCGPSNEQVQCEADGGSWEIDYMMPVITFIKSGSVNVPVTNYIPVYECVE